MRRIFAAAFIALTAAGFLAATIAEADAQSRQKRQQQRELTITGRSFTNSGKHPLPGAEHRYVEQFTQTNRPIYTHSSGFGNSALPGQFGAFHPR
ncbi:MAG: hypothetical protein FJX29_03965 [Alphaproteobacteria bacterium]|nr:hypothetical protein [Alphaproteobacteria bacterium]